MGKGPALCLETLSLRLHCLRLFSIDSTSPDNHSNSSSYSNSNNDLQRDALGIRLNSAVVLELTDLHALPI
jgi:hypothetical protein